MNFNINQSGGRGGKTNLIAGAIILIVALIFLFVIARSIFRILSFAAPVLIILALLINYKVVINYILSIWKNLKSNTIWGIIMILFTVIGFPIVSAYLLGKSIISKRVEALGQEARKQEMEFTEYEEVRDEKDFLELKDLEKKEKGASKNDYENLF